jgi:hypothetical protein
MYPAMAVQAVSTIRQRMGTSLTPPHEVFSMCCGYTTAKKRSGYLHDNRGREWGGEREREREAERERETERER